MGTDTLHNGSRLSFPDVRSLVSNWFTSTYGLACTSLDLHAQETYMNNIHSMFSNGAISDSGWTLSKYHEFICSEMKDWVFLNLKLLELSQEDYMKSLKRELSRYGFTYDFYISLF